MDGLTARLALARMGILSVAALGVSGICAAAPAPAAGGSGAPQLGSFGIDLAAMDKSVKPGDDFYRYVNGHWLATEKIPPDQSSWGSFDILQIRAELDVKAIIETAAAAHAAPGTIEQKIGDFYSAFLDRTKIDRLGVEAGRGGFGADSTRSRRSRRTNKLRRSSPIHVIPWTVPSGTASRWIRKIPIAISSASGNRD